MKDVLIVYIAQKYMNEIAQLLLNNTQLRDKDFDTLLSFLHDNGYQPWN